MGDWDGAPAEAPGAPGAPGASKASGTPGPGGLMAETLGRVMARRAAEIMSRRRGPGDRDSDPERDEADNVIFDAVLDAANECLGRFDARPAADRWCDALLQLLRLAEFDLSR